MKYDIVTLKRKLLVKYPFFGSVIANVNYQETDNLSTAGTDGKIVYYNPEFLRNLDTDEQLFIIAHEVCHIAFNHLIRSQDKQKDIWNVATDAVINQFLKRDGLKLAEGAIDIEEAINYDAETLYEKLLKEMPNNNQNQNGNQEQSSDKNQNNSNNQSDNVELQTNSGNDSSEEQNSNDNSSDTEKSKNMGHDSHSMWEDAIKDSLDEKDQREEEQKKSEEENKNSKKETNQKKNANEMIEQKQQELEKMGEKEAFNKNQDDKRKQLEELRNELLKKASEAGSTTNEDLRNIKGIGVSKPIVDWRYVLKETIKYDVDWSYQNASIENGVVTANLEEIPMPETEIVIDTSGSISNVLLKNFLRECKNILKHTRLKVGCFDTKFYGFTEIRNEQDIDNLNFVGSGGTNFEAAVNAFSMRVENKIIFTDGEACMPDKKIDAIWIVYGNVKIKPNGGKVIYITSEQLDRLLEDEGKTRTR